MKEPERPIVNLPPEKKAWLEQRLRQRMKPQTAQAGMLKRAGAGPHPLSFSQESLWLLHQLYPGLVAYNEPFAYLVSGNLVFSALQASLDSILARHEVLRTIYRLEQGLPAQVIQPHTPLPIPLVDLSALAKDQQPQELERRLQSEARQPFNLGADLMLRACLFRLEPEQHVLLLVRHHIAADGLSERLLEGELAEGYRAALESRPLALPDLALQYADYAIWQRKNWEEPHTQAQIDYWRRELEGSSLLELPTDHPRPAELSYRGGLVRFTVEGDLLVQLRRLCQTEGVTLYMFLLAVFQALLHRYTGQTDICLGTPVAGRRSSEFEPLVGDFVNTLVIRADLSGNLPFRQYLQRLRQIALEAYDHQEVPFEKLVALFQPERQLNRNPLVQVMFQLLHTPFQSPLQLPDLQVKPIEVDPGTAKLDLQMTLVEDQEKLDGSLHYQLDLFDPETAQRLVDHYQNLLESAVAAPQQHISDLRLLNEREARQLRARSIASNPIEPQEGLIHTLFAQQAQRTPDAAAVVYEGKRLTYRELDCAANRLAHRLRSCGVQVETAVGLLAQPSLEMVIGFLGVLKAGGAVVPLDPAAPESRLRAMIADAGVQILLIPSEAQHRRVDLASQQITLDELRGMEGTPEQPPLFDQSGRTLVYILYTSGSTGQPKGVMVEHRQLASYARAIVERIGFRQGDVFAMLQPLTVDACQTMFTPSLCWGGTLHLISRPRALDAAALAEYLRSNPVDHLKVAPSHLTALLSVKPDPDLLPRRNLIIGGEPLHWDLVDRVCQLSGICQVWNHYGPTETTVAVLAFPLPSGAAEAQLRQRSLTVPIGLPLGNSQVAVLDRYGNQLPIGLPGELVVGGDQVARGYLHQPQATARSFLPDLFSSAGGGRLYRTGDRARLLTGGAIEFMGRLDDQVKVRGFRVELGEIEAALVAHPAVAETAVLLRQTDSDQPHLVAYCVPAVGESLDRVVLRKHLQQRLPEYMLPQSVFILERLPRTPQGKLDRQALLLLELDREAESSESGFVAPQTEVERKLAEIWSAVLGIEPISVLDNILELGGNSLTVMQVYARLCQDFKVELPLSVLFENPTIAGLAGLEPLSRDASARFGDSVDLPLIRQAERDRYPVSFAQWRMWFQEQFQSGLGIYNSRGAFRLRGALDIRALELSLNDLLNRHEILRTNLVFERNELWQAIQPFAPISLPVHDLTDLPADERERQAWERVLAEAQRPFDLAKDVMVRPALLRLAPADHILVVIRHHTGSDAWSREIFWRELCELYQAETQGRPPQLPELPLRYADFTIWHQQWLETVGLEGQLAFWREQLDGLVPFELPESPSEFEDASSLGGEARLMLGPSLVQRLRAFSQQEGVTLFMFLLAAYQALFFHHTGLEDFGVGTAVSGRRRAEFEPIIGNFTNTLALRARLSGEMSFRKLLKQVRQTVLAAYENQDLPFDKLVEALHPRRAQQQNPFFRLFFNLPQAEPERLPLPGIHSEWLPIPRNIALFDFNLEIFPILGGLQLVAGYRADRYNPEVVSALLEGYRSLLESILAQPDGRIIYR